MNLVVLPSDEILEKLFRTVVAIYLASTEPQLFLQL